MNPSLPDAKKLISVMLFLLIVGLAYFVGVKKPLSKNNIEESTIESKKISNAFFIPPESTVKEIKVRGRVIKVSLGEFEGATHKVVDGDGKVLVYAYTDDDKLKQQEQSVVTLVGTVPIGTEISPKTLLKVDYISFK